MNELKKLLAEATPGTWSVTDEHEILSVETCNNGKPYENRTLIAQGECSQNWGYIEWFNLADAALIVAAVNALPELLAERDRLREALCIETKGSLTWWVDRAAQYAEDMGEEGFLIDRDHWERIVFAAQTEAAHAALKETGQ